MFKKNGTYFVITATGCGFCPQGSDARPWTASHSPRDSDSQKLFLGAQERVTVTSKSL
jgi:hypothetical protein